MSNLKLAIVLGFTLMFIAGLAVGRTPKATELPKTEQRSWLGNELHLSPDQQTRMKAIWSNPSVTRPDLPRQFHEVDRHRDDAIQNLLTPEQKLEFTQIKKDHDAKIASLSGERDQGMRDAEDQTRQMLSEDQRRRYDEILKAHGHRFGPPRPANARRRAHPEPTTSPSRRAEPTAVAP